MSPSEWLAFAGMSFVLAVAPGPDNLFVLTQSAVLGARAGLYVVLGLCGGLLVQTIAAALGLAIVIQEFPAVFWAIKIAGAAYLCYLAYMAWTHAEDVPGEGGALDLKPWQLVRRADGGAGGDLPHCDRGRLFGLRPGRGRSGDGPAQSQVGGTPEPRQRRFVPRARRLGALCVIGLCF